MSCANVAMCIARNDTGLSLIFKRCMCGQPGTWRGRNRPLALALSYTGKNSMHVV
jgi:hypothetical protein